MVLGPFGPLKVFLPGSWCHEALNAQLGITDEDLMEGRTWMTVVDEQRAERTAQLLPAVSSTCEDALPSPSTSLTAVPPVVVASMPNPPADSQLSAPLSSSRGRHSKKTHSRRVGSGSRIDCSSSEEDMVPGDVGGLEVVASSSSDKETSDVSLPAP
jgi:hypothetical protein